MGPVVTLRPDHYENSAADRVANQTKYGPGVTVGERDTGDIWLRLTGSWKQLASGGVGQTSDTMNGTQFASGTLLDGNAVIIPMAGARMGCVVWTEPAVGDTVTVSYSLDGTTYKVWPHGAITSASADKSDTILGAITHIKFQRTGGAGVTSTYGVTR